MKRALFIWVFAILSFPLSAQFGGLDVEGFISNPNSSSYYRQQKKEIGNTIRSEVEAQARAKRQSSQLTQTNQSSNNQAVQSYNNRISVEGQQRMEYYNNPDNYINRDITNRRSSYFNNERRSPRSQTRGLGTEPIHSENLNSKSLQSLREANRSQFSSPDEIDWGRPVYVQLFDEPNLLDEHHPLVKKPDLVQWAWNEHARRMKLEKDVAARNDMIDLTKKGVGIVGGILVKGSMSVGALLSANLNVYSELAKYWNECSSGARMAKTSDTFEILGEAALNTLVDVAVPWVGDEVGVAYVGVEKMGTDGMRVFNSLQIGLSLSDFAVNNEKSEE